MESTQDLKETINLDLSEENELLFKIQIEGAEEPAKVRLVCEGDDLSFMFDGVPTEEKDIVQFVIPEMKGKLKEGRFDSKVEVMIGNKYFAPVEFRVNFKQETKVVVESIQVPKVQKKKPALAVSATPVIAVRPRKKKPVQSKSISGSIENNTVESFKTKKVQQKNDTLFSRYQATKNK